MIPCMDVHMRSPNGAYIGRLATNRCRRRSGRGHASHYRRWLGIIVLAFLTVACQQPVSRVESVDGLAPLKPVAAASLLEIDPLRSQLLVKVYREGRMANLGHNHIISSGLLAGEVYLAPDIVDSVVEVRVPVERFVVDDPSLRAEAGPDFTTALDADAVSGTRANMLGEKQLDAANWPQIILRGRIADGQLPQLALTAEVRVRDQVHAFNVPIDVAVIEGSLRATGRFSLSQTELGLVPFSVMMGALRVRDTLDIEFDITASRPAS